MLHYRSAGALPPKHHIVHKVADALTWEECFTRDGFDGAYAILYHQNRPHEQVQVSTGQVFPSFERLAPTHIEKQHIKGFDVPASTWPSIQHRLAMFKNDELTVSISRPGADDTQYFVNGDADTLLFVYEGGGTLRTPMGDVAFVKDDYVFVPKGMLHRFLLAGANQYWLVMELQSGMHLPRQFRNDTGQLRMDAPYCHRDFRGPEFFGSKDEGIRQTVVKRRGTYTVFAGQHSPLDVVGWDGNVYPWAFPILSFQPRAGQVHLPPTLHGTFAGKGVLVCSFVPRMVDFHPEAIPCPYPHSSVDVDEFIFYVRGNFTSRRGISPASMSFHPAGVPHGPHPGAYEKSIGHQRTDELAVMIDTAQPLDVTNHAMALLDSNYEQSFVA